MTATESAISEFPLERIESLKKVYNERKIDFIRKHLTEDELKVIDKTPGMFAADYVYWAAVNNILHNKLALASRINEHYHHKDSFHYVKMLAAFCGILIIQKSYAHPSMRETRRTF